MSEEKKTDTLIHAFTAPGHNYPPYINVTRLADGSVRVIVRTMPDDAGEGTTSAMRMSEADWRSLAWSIYAENEDYMRAHGRPVTHHGSGGAAILPGPPDGPVFLLALSAE
jgi:hypothetical protein